MTRPAPRCYDAEGYPLACSVCGKPQFYTPSGSLCVNGHGGADGVPIPRPSPAVIAARGRAARQRGDLLWFYHPESDAWVRMTWSEWTRSHAMELVEVGTDEERDAFEAAGRKHLADNIPARDREPVHDIFDVDIDDLLDDPF